VSHIAKQVELPLADWAGDLRVPMLQMKDGDGYIPIKPLIKGLTGSENDAPHHQRINRDQILSHLKCYLPVQTPGGTQEMLCLPWLGIGRFIDRISLESVREPYRAQVLNVMWGITFAAYEVVSGKRTLPNLITIVPGDRILASIPEAGLRRFLEMIAERMGRMEIASRNVVDEAAGMRDILTTLLGPGREGESCPCCGRPYAG
jgi:hypothetical protein